MELSICWSKHLISDRVYFEIDLIKDDDEGNWKSAIGWKSCPFQCFFLALQIPKDLKFSSNIVGCRWRWPNWNAGQKNKSLEILITFHHQQRPVNGCCSMCPRENCLPMNLVGLACKWSDMVWFEFVTDTKARASLFPLWSQWRVVFDCFHYFGATFRNVDHGFQGDSSKILVKQWVGSTHDFCA